MAKIEIVGQVAKIATLADGSIRLAVDVQPENAPDDIFTWIYQMISLSKDKK